MESLLRPVIAFKEDIDAWVYFDQIQNVFRYEIYCIGYDSFGRSSTLEFVVEEGTLSLDEFPELRQSLAVPAPRPIQPWVQIDDHFLLLSGGVPPGKKIPEKLLLEWEKRLKLTGKQRIMRKLRALGYDVLWSVNS